MNPPPRNLLVLVHGMIPNPGPGSQDKLYSDFWRNLKAREPELVPHFSVPPVHVEWGHELPGGSSDLRDDQKLTRAEKFVSDQVRYDVVRQDPGPNNIIMSGFFGSDWGIPILRGKLTEAREKIVQFGLADVVYYCSEEGERQVRKVVYEQILGALEPIRKEKNVRLHLVGHSLGVTLVHDFLFGLFGAESPGFLKEKQGSTKAMARFRHWKKQAAAGKLSVGTFVAMASQLPLFIMRKQSLVDRLAERRKLDPEKIGIRETEAAVTRWILFYDIDDLLGFATRNLYEPATAIRDVQVDAGDLPTGAHTGLWENDDVLDRSARLLLENARMP